MVSYFHSDLESISLRRYKLRWDLNWRVDIFWRAVDGNEPVRACNARHGDSLVGAMRTSSPSARSVLRSSTHEWATSTWVVIAAYNEAPMIGKVVRELKYLFPNVLVIDDGSSDETQAEALSAGAMVARHCINLGQGAALQTGIDCALANGARFIATFDADGQHSPEDIVAMLERMQQTSSDVALASRFLGNTVGIDPWRRRFLQATVVIQRWTTGAELTDVHNGLRVFRDTAIRKCKIRQNRMAHASEIISYVLSNNIKFIEVPCTIRYTSYSRSKGQRLTGAARILLDLILIRMYR
jgi:polyprenyl-phospho-N-acetylgalactosaminyl synthase